MTNPGSFSSQLIHDLAQGKDILFLIRRLTQVLNRPVLVTNSIHRIIAFHDPLGLDLKLDEFFYVPDVKIKEEDLLNRSESLLHQIQYTPDVYPFPFVYLPLLSGDYCLGYCIVPEKCRLSGALKLSPLGGEDKQYILDAVIPLILALRSNREDEARQEEYRDEFVRDILYNNYDSKAAIYERTKLWGWNLQGSLLALVVDTADQQLKTARALIPRLFNSALAISACINRQLVIILNIDKLKKAELKTALDDFISDYTSRPANCGKNRPLVGVGVGSGVPSVIDLYKSYQEAKVALELGKVFDQKPVCYFEEMGFLKFVFTQPAMELEEFSQRILGALIDYDFTAEVGLLDTLKVFIECNCQTAKCARALYIHENTLYNRLKKIEQLTGFDLRRVDHMVNVYIALQVLNLGKER